MTLPDWFLTREQRLALKTLDRLTDALHDTHEHIKELVWVATPGEIIGAALERADEIVEAIADTARSPVVPPEIDELSERVITAARHVLKHLNDRIEAAPMGAKPAFEGIAELAAALRAFDIHAFDARKGASK